MKKMYLLLGFLLSVSAQAACHKVVDRSEENPNTNPQIDELCIDQQDFVTLKNKGKTIYSFQSIYTVTPYEYRCGLGREGDRCANIGSQMYLNYEDNLVSFEAHVSEGQGSFGAQYLEFDQQSYKFWVKGRR